MDGGDERAVVEAAHDACARNRDLHVSLHTARGYTVHVRGDDSWFEPRASSEDTLQLDGRVADPESAERLLATARARGYAADY